MNRTIFGRTTGAVVIATVAGMAVMSVPGSAQQAKNTPPKTAKTVGVGGEIYGGLAAAADGIKLTAWGSGEAIEDGQYRSVGDKSIKVVTNGFYSGARLQFNTPRDITEEKNDPYGFLEFIIRFQPGTLKSQEERMELAIQKQGRRNTRGGAYGGGGSSGGSSGAFGPGSSGSAPPGYGGSSGAFGPGSSGGSSGAFGPGTSGGSSSGSAPGRPGFGPGGFAPPGAFGNPGGFGPPGGYPGAGGFGAPGEEGTKSLAPDTKNMKISLVCQEGIFTVSRFPVILTPAQQEGWYSVAIPFVAFKGLDKAATARLKEIRIFGDTQDTFWIGEIHTTTDEEPINVDPLEELEVSVGEAVEFRAQATGGISPLHYSWDFDLNDGIQEDATGQNVVHVFRKPSSEVAAAAGELQPYVVTLTVTDLSGAKKQVRRQANVIVNP